MREAFPAGSLTPANLSRSRPGWNSVNAFDGQAADTGRHSAHSARARSFVLRWQRYRPL
jgi:hypothetical protein